MSLTREAYDDRFWRGKELHALRKVAQGWKVPDHVYGWSTASTNPFEAISEHLKLLTILAENKLDLAKSAGLQELEEESLDELHSNFQRVRGETSNWVKMLQSLANESLRLESDINKFLTEKRIRGVKPE